MRPILTLLFALLWLFSQGQSAPPTINELQERLARLGPHPRLLASDKDLPRMQEQLGDPLRQKLHQDILTECDKLLSLPPVERIQIGRRLLDKSRECLRRVFQLSYAFRMTGDKKYFLRAEKELLAVSAFSDWNPSHFLDVAEMTLAVAIGYDWLYQELSPASRSQLKSALLDKGINPSLDAKNNSFLKATNNWNQVCNAGMAFGVLAIAEDEPELAATILQRAVATVPVSIAVYQPDGAYPEGYGYWEYGTSFNVLLVDALEKALGTDFGLGKLPGFMPTAGFLQNMIAPSFLVHNWGDCGLRASLSPATFWFASKLRDPSLLWMEKQLFQQPAANFTRNRIIPALLIWAADVDLEKVTPPASNMWVGQGPSPVGLMRTSWTDENALFVGVKAGSAAVNHAHMDAGSFVLDGLGERWAMDFGMQDYHSLESKGIALWGRSQDSQRWQVFRYNNMAHNTLTIDGQLHQVTGHAAIDEWSDQEDNLFTVSDLSKVFEGQARHVKRGVAIRNRSEVLIRDEVEAPQEKSITVRWNLVTPAKVQVLDGKTVQLSQNGKTVFLTFDTNAGIQIKTWSTASPNDYDAPNPNSTMVGFETIIPAGASRHFNTVFGKRSGSNIPVKPLAEWKRGL